MGTRIESVRSRSQPQSSPPTRPGENKISKGAEVRKGDWLAAVIWLAGMVLLVLLLVWDALTGLFRSMP